MKKKFMKAKQKFFIKAQNQILLFNISKMMQQPLTTKKNQSYLEKSLKQLHLRIDNDKVKRH